MQKTAPPTRHTPQDLLTAADITRLLRIDKSTAYRMAEDGRLPAFKVGRQWRFRAEDVAALLGADVAASPAGPINVPHALELAEFFGALFGVMVVVTDMEGRPLTEVINPHRYFSLLAADPGVIEACTAEWRGFGADQELRPLLRDSHLGFRCARAFIRSGRELVGMVVAGGLAASTAAVPEVPGLDTDTLTAAANDLPVLDERGESEFLAALSVLARHMSERTHPRRPT